MVSVPLPIRSGVVVDIVGPGVRRGEVMSAQPTATRPNCTAPRTRHGMSDHRPRARTRIRPLPAADLVGLVRAVAHDRRGWLDRVRFGADTQRWWTRLSSDPAVDVWLLTWLAGHTTEFHDHGGSAAAFTVTHGTLAELRVGSRGRLRALRHGSGTATYLAPMIVHDVRNGGSGPAVSIHAYSPPLTSMTYYEPDASGLLRPSGRVATDRPEQEFGGTT